MDTHSLSATYRRLCSRRLVPAESAGLADLLSGERAPASGATLDDLAGTPGMAELSALLRELEPESARLAGEVSRLQRAHPGRGRRGFARPQQRHRGSAAPRRWLGGLAACLAVAFGLTMTLRSVDDPGPWRNVASESSSVADPAGVFDRDDVIFAASGEAPPQAHEQHPSDRLFRSTFALGG